MNYLVAVLPALHEPKPDTPQLAKPTLSSQYLLTKPRAKSLGVGSFDIDHGISFVVSFIILVLPKGTYFALLTDTPIAKTFSAFFARAPPDFSSDN